jgi:hypothetical protein
MTQNTKLAWEYVPSVPQEGVECYWIRAPKAIGSLGVRMVDVASVNGPQGADQEAIANLFASATELLEALEAFVGCARYDPTMDGKGAFKGWSQSDLRRAETRARAAIAKARTQSQRENARENHTANH